jgi:hypothetical protein
VCSRARYHGVSKRQARWHGSDAENEKPAGGRALIEHRF